MEPVSKTDEDKLTSKSQVNSTDNKNRKMTVQRQGDGPMSAESADSSSFSDDNDVALQSSKPNVDVSKNARRRHRRRKGGTHHTHYKSNNSETNSRKSHGTRKPYKDLSVEEKNRISEQQNRKSAAKRLKRLASGLAMAPFNTTQFLMEQQTEGDKDENDYETPSDVESLHNQAIELLQEKEFSDAYYVFHNERLHKMSKSELITQFIELEGKYDQVRKDCEELKGILSNCDKCNIVCSEHLVNDSQTIASKDMDCFI